MKTVTMCGRLSKEKASGCRYLTVEVTGIRGLIAKVRSSEMFDGWKIGERN